MATLNYTYAPVVDAKGRLRAIIQAVNKTASAFGKDDNEVLGKIATVTAGLLQKQATYEKTVRALVFSHVKLCFRKEVMCSTSPDGCEQAQLAVGAPSAQHRSGDGDQQRD